MKDYNVEFSVKNLPKYDPDFMPLGLFNKAFLKTAKEPIAVAIERNAGLISVHDTFIHGTEEMYEADCYYIERLVKFLLWGKGGFKIIIFGNKKVYDYINSVYSENGARSFDFVTMGNIYERPFEVVWKPYSEKCETIENFSALGGHTDGCRIGFDAGGSDRKVSAVIDGEVVYSEEVVWHPKLNADPEYHYGEILTAFKTAASKMPRVDAIGVSSAGIFVDNKARLVSLFIKVPRDVFEDKVKHIYDRVCKEMGDIPYFVANDGDVTALAGAIELGDSAVLGISMGTSEAGGYVNPDGYVTGWLNELAFTPVDANPSAMEDEWSGDIGCGVKYLSQDGIIKLAEKAGIDLSAGNTPAEKLVIVQNLAEKDDETALGVYDSIGCYLGHILPFYADFYEYRNVLLLGRVTSGKGGERVIAECKRVLADEYPEFKVNMVLPDENNRRVGQSVAAAGLPKIK